MPWKRELGPRRPGGSTGERTSAESNTPSPILEYAAIESQSLGDYSRLFLGNGPFLKVHHATCNIITKYGLKRYFRSTPLENTRVYMNRLLFFPKTKNKTNNLVQIKGYHCLLTGAGSAHTATCCSNPGSHACHPPVKESRAQCWTYRKMSTWSIP